MKTDNSKQLNKKPEVKSKAFAFALKIFIAVVVAGGLVVGSWQLVSFYRDKIFPRVLVGSLKVGGKTPTEAKKIVDDYIEQINKQGPHISFTDAGEVKNFNPQLTDLGVSFETQKMVDEAYNFGRNGDWLNRVKTHARLAVKGYNIPLDPKIDEKKLDAYLSQMASVVEVQPVNSTLKYTNGEFVATAAKDGRGLDKNYLKTALNNFIEHDNNDVIKLSAMTLAPAIKEDTAVLAKPQADKFLAAADIKMTFEDKEFTARRAEIASWLDFPIDNNQLKTTISTKELAGFVNSIAKQIEINKVDREVTDGTGEVRNEGQDGRGVNKDNLTQEIRNRLNAGSTGEAIAIATFVIPKGQVTYYPSAAPGRFAGRYIDINLSEQIMRLFENKNQVGEYQVSTGKWSMPTPIGTRYIEDKNPRAWSAKYGLYMPFWNGIGEGYGIHELPEWPNGYKEGEAHLGTPVSHGCIRLGVGPAETVYNWAAIGTPVYIHK